MNSFFLVLQASHKKKIKQKTSKATQNNASNVAEVFSSF